MRAALTRHSTRTPEGFRRAEPMSLQGKCTTPSRLCQIGTAHEGIQLSLRDWSSQYTGRAKRQAGEKGACLELRRHTDAQAPPSLLCISFAHQSRGRTHPSPVSRTESQVKVTLLMAELFMGLHTERVQRRVASRSTMGCTLRANVMQ